MSKFLNLKISDWLKGLLVAIGTAVLTGLYKWVEAGTFPVTWADWKVILIGGLAAGIAYVLKNLFSNSVGQVGKPEPKKEEPLTPIPEP